MATLLETPLGTLLNEPNADQASLPLQALIVRAARLAYELGSQLPDLAVTQALTASSNQALVEALGSLLVAEAATHPYTAHSASEQRPAAVSTDRLANFQVRLQGQLKLRQLLDETGGLIRADEARELLGVTRATLQQWRENHRILALPIGNSFAYPAAQFVPGPTDLDVPRPLSGLQDVLAAAKNQLQPAELFALLATPQQALGQHAGLPRWRTGFDALRDGESHRVAQLVTHITTAADADAPSQSAEAPEPPAAQT